MRGGGVYVCIVFVVKLGMEKRIALLDTCEGSPVGPLAGNF